MSDHEDVPEQDPDQELTPLEQLDRDLDEESHADQRYLAKPRKLGRPTDYDPAFCAVVTDLCARGATLAEVADELGVAQFSVWRWRNKYPEFSAALKMGSEACDQRVEDSLYNRAVGYTYHSVKVTKDGDQIPIEIHLPPDPGAINQWLTNRRPDRWRNAKTLEITKSPESDLKTIDSILTRFTQLQEASVVATVPKKLTNGSGKK